jgi:glycosyltransferase involved in cell wall biosynthesis
MSPLVSVIMAVRDGERFLPQALRSVLGQDHRPVEIIVVDDGSTDGTCALEGSFPDTRWIHQENRGLSAARNRGLDAARGELVAFLDADDWWEPEALSVHLDALRACPDIRYAVAMVRHFLEPGCAVPPGFRASLLEADIAAEIMGTFVGYRDLFETVGGFDPSLRMDDDLDWFARAHERAIPRMVIPRVLLHKRVHDRNLSLGDPRGDRHLLHVLKRSIERRRAGGE